MAIINAQLTLLPVEILTVPAGKTYAITNILVCNTDATDSASFDMHLIPSGDPLDPKVTKVINNLVLPAGETFTFDSERIVLEAGDKVTFVAEPDSSGSGAGTTDLAATISYLEV